MKILIYEHLSSGAWRKDHQEHLLPEGAAMLAALLKDFSAVSGCTTITVLDPHLDRGKFVADQIFPGGISFGLQAFRELTAAVDAVLVLAPEIGGILAELTEIVEQAGKLLLGSSKEAVEPTTYKQLTLERWLKADLPIPSTEIASTEIASLQILKTLPLPLVLKPVDGAGSSYTYVIRSQQQLERVWHSIAAEKPAPFFLAQEYLRGNAASVSLIVSPGSALPLSLNQQLLEVGETIHYAGSTVGLAHPLAQEAVELAEKACTLFPGLCGYVGVDMVLTPEGAVLMEINPRITTSYLALRRAIDTNLAWLILRACTGEKLPASVNLTSPVTISIKQLADEFGEKGMN